MFCLSFQSCLGGGAQGSRTQLPDTWRGSSVQKDPVFTHYGPSNPINTADCFDYLKAKHCSRKPARYVFLDGMLIWEYFLKGATYCYHFVFQINAPCQAESKPSIIFFMQNCNMNIIKFLGRERKKVKNSPKGMSQWLESQHVLFISVVHFIMRLNGISIALSCKD